MIEALWGWLCSLVYLITQQYEYSILCLFVGTQQLVALYRCQRGAVMGEYRIYLDQVADYYKKGYLTASGLIQSVIEITKPSLPIEDVQGFCKQYGISRSAFYRATKRLQELENYPVTEQDSREKAIRNRLQSQLGGLTEVATPVGRIDLLTDLEIVEVKEISEWKHAMGQVLAYSGFYPEHKRRIHLFASKSNTSLEYALLQVRFICDELNIIVTFEEVKGDS